MHSDLLIYHHTRLYKGVCLYKELVEHVEWVMQCLSEAGLYLKPGKCEFHKEAAKYLSLIISGKGISMDEDKEGTVQNRSQG